MKSLEILEQNTRLISTRYLIACGGDTDTICSMAGNIIGAYKQEDRLEKDEIRLIDDFKKLPEFNRIDSLIESVDVI